MRRNFNGALVALVVVAVSSVPALARGNDLVIKTGQGEELSIRNGFFGRKTTVVKDRLGNGYATKTGLFGSKEQQVNILGNTIERKKGWFGGSNVQGSTIFGDRVSTKRGIFGRRTTEVDVSGTANLVKSLWQKHGPSITGKSTAAPLAPLSTPAAALAPAVTTPALTAPEALTTPTVMPTGDLTSSLDNILNKAY
jgi:hypothetical protein